MEDFFMIKKEKLGIFFILLLVLITLPVISANEDVNSTIDNDFVLVEVKYISQVV